MSGYTVVIGDGHLPDTALLALIDGETSETAVLKTHLQSCRDCDARLTALEQASQMLRASLPAVAIPAMSPPKARAVRRHWAFSYPAAAAATVLLLASVATATPVRHWITRKFSVVASTPPAVPSSSPSVANAASAPGIIASFAATDTVLEIRVAARQNAGWIHLIASTSDRISAQAVAGATAEELVVLPGQLRIINSATSVADYRIAIPSAVRSVVVIVGGERVGLVRFDRTLNRRILLTGK